MNGCHQWPGLGLRLYGFGQFISQKIGLETVPKCKAVLSPGEAQSFLVFSERAWTVFALQNTAEPQMFSSALLRVYVIVHRFFPTPPLHLYNCSRSSSLLYKHSWLSQQLKAVLSSHIGVWYPTWGRDSPLSCVSSALCGCRTARLRPATPERSAWAKKSWLCWTKYTRTIARKRVLRFCLRSSSMCITRASLPSSVTFSTWCWTILTSPAESVPGWCYSNLKSRTCTPSSPEFVIGTWCFSQMTVRLLILDTVSLTMQRTGSSCCRRSDEQHTLVTYIHKNMSNM